MTSPVPHLPSDTAHDPVRVWENYVLLAAQQASLALIGPTVRAIVIDVDGSSITLRAALTEAPDATVERDFENLVDETIDNLWKFEPAPQVVVDLHVGTPDRAWLARSRRSWLLLFVAYKDVVGLPIKP